MPSRCVPVQSVQGRRDVRGNPAVGGSEIPHLSGSDLKEEDWSGVAGRARRAGQKKLLFIDARWACFNAVSTSLAYGQLPEEDAEPGMCGMLNKYMYGTRDAARRWEETYTEHLLNLGFKQGQASPCCFSHGTRDIQCVVHGDDFTFLGEDADLDWIQTALAQKFGIKVRGSLGDGPGDVQEMRILSRVVQWTKHGITYEADQRHAEIIIKQFNLIAANSVVAAGEKDRAPEHGVSLLMLVVSVPTGPSRLASTTSPKTGQTSPTPARKPAETCLHLLRRAGVK